jgi:shikimate kinase
MKSSIALIGFMAIGKSAVGKVLAAKTGKTFIEIDSLIEEKAGKSVKRIFREEGEIAFREYEIAMIKEFFFKKNLILACGGGAVLNKINIDRLKQEAVIIWLTASIQSILERIKNSGETRPLISGKDLEKEVQSLLRFRQPFYQRAADIKVDTTGLTVDQAAEAILKKLGKYANYH